MAKLTKRVVETAEPQSRDYVIWDDELPGFGLRVFVSGKRSHIIQYRSAGRSRRYTIGLHGVWTPEIARKEARIQLGRVAQGDLTDRDAGPREGVDGGRVKEVVLGMSLERELAEQQSLDVGA